MSQELTLFLILAGENFGLLGKELGSVNETNNGVQIVFPFPPFLFYRTTYKEVKTRDSMFRGDILLLLITETLGTHAMPQNVPRRSFMLLHT